MLRLATVASLSMSCGNTDVPIISASKSHSDATRRCGLYDPSATKSCYGRLNR